MTRILIQWATSLPQRHGWETAGGLLCSLDDEHKPQSERLEHHWMASRVKLHCLEILMYRSGISKYGASNGFAVNCLGCIKVRAHNL